jgi:hypothetical protein
MTYGLAQRIKYVRLVQRKASSPQAKEADTQGYRYAVQLALEGVPYRKPMHKVGSDTVGADVGPSTIALVPQQAASAALASVRLWRRSRAAGPVLRVPGGLS